MKKEEIIKNLLEKREKLIKEYVGKAYSSVTMFRDNSKIDILSFYINTTLNIFKIVDLFCYCKIDEGENLCSKIDCDDIDLDSLNLAMLDKVGFYPVIDQIYIDYRNFSEIRTGFSYLKNKKSYENLSNIHKYKEMPSETFDRMVEVTHSNINKLINLNIEEFISEDKLSTTYPGPNVLDTIRSKYELLELTKVQSAALIWHPFVYGNYIIVNENSLEFIEDKLNQVLNTPGKEELSKVYNKMKSILDARLQEIQRSK